MLSSGSFSMSRACMMRIAVRGDILYMPYPLPAMRKLMKSMCRMVKAKGRRAYASRPFADVMMCAYLPDAFITDAPSVTSEASNQYSDDTSALSGSSAVATTLIATAPSVSAFRATIEAFGNTQY